MTEEQSAAYVMSQSACALITAMGMYAANVQRENLGHSMAYTEEAFENLLTQYGIHHNAVLSTFAHGG